MLATDSPTPPTPQGPLPPQARAGRPRAPGVPVARNASLKSVAEPETGGRDGFGDTCRTRHRARFRISEGHRPVTGFVTGLWASLTGCYPVPCDSTAARRSAVA